MRRIFKASMISKKSLCFQETYKFKGELTFLKWQASYLGLLYFTPFSQKQPFEVNAL